MPFDLESLRAIGKKKIQDTEKCPHCGTWGGARHPIGAHEKSFDQQCMNCGETSPHRLWLEAAKGKAEKPKKKNPKVGKGKQVAVDLDGTLAHYDDDQVFDPQVIGDPVPEMLANLQQYIHDGYEPVLFTARACEPSNIPPIEAWLKKHKIPIKVITNQKTPTMAVFLDDRAVGVHMNRGTLKSAAVGEPYSPIKPGPTNWGSVDVGGIMKKTVPGIRTDNPVPVRPTFPTEFRNGVQSGFDRVPNHNIPEKWVSKAPNMKALTAPVKSVVIPTDGTTTVITKPRVFKQPIYSTSWGSEIQKAHEYNANNNLPGDMNLWDKNTPVKSTPGGLDSFDTIEGSVEMNVEAGRLKGLKEWRAEVESPKRLGEGATNWTEADIIKMAPNRSIAEHELTHAGQMDSDTIQFDGIARKAVNSAWNPGEATPERHFPGVSMQHSIGGNPHDIYGAEARAYISKLQEHLFQTTGKRIESPEDYDRVMQELKPDDALHPDINRYLRQMEKVKAGRPDIHEILHNWGRRVAPGIVSNELNSPEAVKTAFEKLEYTDALKATNTDPTEAQKEPKLYKRWDEEVKVAGEAYNPIKPGPANWGTGPAAIPALKLNAPEMGRIRPLDERREDWTAPAPRASISSPVDAAPILAEANNDKSTAKLRVKPRVLKQPMYGDAWGAEIQKAHAYNKANNLPGDMNRWDHDVAVSFGHVGIGQDSFSGDDMNRVVRMGDSEGRRWRMLGQGDIPAVLKDDDGRNLSKDDTVKITKTPEVLHHELAHSGLMSKQQARYDDEKLRVMDKTWIPELANSPDVSDAWVFNDKDSPNSPVGSGSLHDLNGDEQRVYLSALQEHMFKTRGKRIETPEEFDRVIQELKPENDLPFDVNRYLRQMEKTKSVRPDIHEVLHNWARRITPGIVSNELNSPEAVKTAFEKLEYADALKATNTDPTEAQKESGNYKKGRFDWHGLAIAVENPKGSIRRGISSTGKKWQTVMKNTYGYITNAPDSGADGDKVDVFIGNHPEHQLIGVVDQYHGEDFDEHKCVLGVKDATDAEETYLSNYQKGWKGCGDVTLLTIDQFKSWLKKGDTSKPLAGQKFETFHKTAGWETSHTKTLPDGRILDVLKLIEILQDREVIDTPIAELKGFSDSKRSGFSDKRYEAADTAYPVIRDTDGNVLDGRHRLLKLQNTGGVTARAVTASPEDIEAALTGVNKTAAAFDTAKVSALIRAMAGKLKWHSVENSPLASTRTIGDIPKLLWRGHTGAAPVGGGRFSTIARNLFKPAEVSKGHVYASPLIDIAANHGSLGMTADYAKTPGTISLLSAYKNHTSNLFGAHKSVPNALDPEVTGVIPRFTWDGLKRQFSDAGKSLHDLAYETSLTSSNPHVSTGFFKHLFGGNGKPDQRLYAPVSHLPEWAEIKKLLAGKPIGLEEASGAVRLSDFAKLLESGVKVASQTMEFEDGDIENAIQMFSSLCKTAADGKFPRPENFDREKDIKGVPQNYQLYVGANDWENCGWTWAAIYPEWQAAYGNQPVRWLKIDHSNCPECKGDVDHYSGKSNSSREFTISEVETWLSGIKLDKLERMYGRKNVRVVAERLGNDLPGEETEKTANAVDVTCDSCGNSECFIIHGASVKCAGCNNDYEYTKQAGEAWPYEHTPEGERVGNSIGLLFPSMFRDKSRNSLEILAHGSEPTRLNPNDPTDAYSIMAITPASGLEEFLHSGNNQSIVAHRASDTGKYRFWASEFAKKFDRDTELANSPATGPLKNNGRDVDEVFSYACNTAGMTPETYESMLAHPLKKVVMTPSGFKGLPTAGVSAVPAKILRMFGMNVSPLHSYEKVNDAWVDRGEYQTAVDKRVGELVHKFKEMLSRAYSKVKDVSGDLVKTANAFPEVTPQQPTEVIPTTGIAAIAHRLRTMDMAAIRQQAMDDLKSGKKTRRPNAVKLLSIIEGLTRNKLTPANLLLTKVPVLPPQYRPYAVAGDTLIPGNENELYRDLMHARRQHRELSNVFGPESAHSANQTVYDSVKALMGYGDPVNAETKARGVTGFMGRILGSGPKQSWLMSKMIAKPVDTVGRSVISVNPDLNINQIGMPEEMAWRQFQPHLVRRMVQRGVKQVEAIKAVKARNPLARQTLMKLIETHPVVYSRAPAWHKFSVMSGYARIVDGDAIQSNPYITTGAGADFDGDRQLAHVVVVTPLNTPENDTNQNPAQHLTSRISSETVDFMIKSGQIPWFDKNTHALQIVDLADFPRGETSASSKGGKTDIDVFHVPEGTKVIAYDEVAGQSVWADVARYSVHVGAETEIVSLSTGRQIFTDDDPRAVYGVATADDSMALSRFTPTDALTKRVAVPFVKSTARLFDRPGVTEITVTEDPECVFRKLPLNWETGYMMGVFCGDGWWDKKDTDFFKISGKRHLLVSDLKGFNAGRVATILRRLCGDIGFQQSTHEFLKADHPGRYGDTVRYSFTFRHSEYMAEFFTEILGGSGDEATTGSGNKHLPPFFAAAPEDFRKGLFCGLIDTDGTVCITNEKTRKNGQLAIAFTSTSLRLARDIKFLAMTLGINGHVSFSKTTSAGNTAWLTSFSSVDCKASDVLMGLQSPWKRDEFIRGQVDEIGGTSAISNSVPITKGILGKLKTNLISPKITKLDRQIKAPDLEFKKEQSNLCIALWQAAPRGLISKYIATCAIEMLWKNHAAGERTVAGALSILRDTSTTGKIHAKNLQVVRDAIKTVAPITGNADAYDFGNTMYARTNLVLKRGTAGPKWCRGMIEFLESAPPRVCIADDPELVAWKSMINNKEVSWAMVESVEKTGQKEVGYDLCVPGYETFMNVDGVILSNTFNIHVPATDDAIEEAKTRLLPSNSVFKIRDPDSVMPQLKHEQILGLTGAQNAKPKQRHQFASEAEAMEAVNSGKISMSDEVEWPDPVEVPAPTAAPAIKV